MTEQERPGDRIVERTTAVPSVVGDLSRYDLVLVVIPVAYLLALLGGSLFESTRLGLTVASVVAALVVADALFVHPPLGRGGGGAGDGI